MVDYAVEHVRARHLTGCVAGLLRFATRAEIAALLDWLPAETLHAACRPQGLANRAVIDELLRARRPGDLKALARMDWSTPRDHVLGALIALNDEKVDTELFRSRHTPRNLLRLLAHRRRLGTPPPPRNPLARRNYVTRLDGVSPKQANACLYSGDPDVALAALTAIGRGADPAGALHVCRVLLGAGRLGEQVLPMLPNMPWGPGSTYPPVRRIAARALEDAEGVAALRALADRVRRPEPLRSIAELDDTAATEPWRTRSRALVTRRHPDTINVDWPAVAADAREPLPRRAALFIVRRPDAPPELVRAAVAAHPALVTHVPRPTLDMLAGLSGDILTKTAGNGLAAETITPEELHAALTPDQVLKIAEGTWLPALRGVAGLRTLLRLDTNAPLSPFLIEETGHRRRDTARTTHWDPRLIYGERVLAELYHGPLSADHVLAMVDVDMLLTRDADQVRARTVPDPRVLRRLAELIHVHLGGRPAAWMVAIQLLNDGFAGTLPELITTAGAVGAD